MRKKRWKRAKENGFEGWVVANMVKERLVLKKECGLGRRWSSLNVDMRRYFIDLIIRIDQDRVAK